MEIKVESVGKLAATPEGSKWRLIDTLPVHIAWFADYGFRAHQHRLSVPAGFVTDFASVPRLPLVYAAFGNMAHRAATVHDWLYSDGNGTDIRRHEADEIFRQIAIRDGVSELKAYLMWLAVTIVGGRHWMKKGTGHERG